MSDISDTETNEIAALPPELPRQEPAPVVPPPSRHEPAPRRTAWPAAFGLGFLLLAGGEAFLYQLHQTQSAQVAQLSGQTATITSATTQLAVLQTEVADLRTLAAHTQPAPDAINVQADLTMKLATLAAQVNAVQSQTAADHATLATLQGSATQLSKLAAQMAQLSSLEAARAALEAGQPLGIIPGAPPALAAFATTPPPTEAALRLAFPGAAQAAEAASIAGNIKGNFWSRVLARLEGLVTIRDGTHVLIGAPASGVLAEAQAELDAGDLAGAVAQVETLSAPTQAAMGNWLSQAKALLAARAALAGMASQ
jgi:hypothetical protein